MDRHVLRERLTTRDRAITPGIAVAAMVAVSVTLAAVLGTWMLTANPGGTETVDAQTEIRYEGGELTVRWTDAGNADRLRIAVGTDVRIVNEVGSETTLPASPDEQVVVVAERADGDAAVLSRDRVETFEEDDSFLGVF
ncbi:MAG: hypothetical protein J07HB67_02582 [halophilic archaeon J07HB67]|jgi:hypothetical protein|nr:MAG: hypothetical protein J07HB67_02582 [halophilic archaeon J07HB67]